MLAVGVLVASLARRPGAHRVRVANGAGRTRHRRLGIPVERSARRSLALRDGRIAEHPWIGAGLGKWTSSEAFVVQFGDPLLMHAHNTFLNRALETGLPGLAAFVYLLGSVVVAFLRVARSDDPDTAAIGAAGLALVAGVVLKNLTDDFFVRQNALLFWALVGAGLGARRRARGSARRRSGVNAAAAAR